MARPYRVTEEQRRELFWSKVDKSGECWVWTSPATNGSKTHPYGRFCVGRDALGKTILRSAHTLSWEWANDRPVPDGMVVRHSCDNTLCVRPDHLILGTQQDNLQDMRDRGRDQWSKKWSAQSGEPVREGTITSALRGPTAQASVSAVAI